MSALPPADTSVNVVATDRSGRRLSYFHPVMIDTAAAAALAGQLGFGRDDHLLLAGYPHPDDEILLRWAAAARSAGSTVWLDIGPTLAGFTLDRLAQLMPFVTGPMGMTGWQECESCGLSQRRLMSARSD